MTSGGGPTTSSSRAPTRDPRQPSSADRAAEQSSRKGAGIPAFAGTTHQDCRPRPRPETPTAAAAPTSRPNRPASTPVPSPDTRHAPPRGIPAYAGMTRRERNRDGTVPSQAERRRPGPRPGTPGSRTATQVQGSRRSPGRHFRIVVPAPETPTAAAEPDQPSQQIRAHARFTNRPGTRAPGEIPAYVGMTRRERNGDCPTPSQTKRRRPSPDGTQAAEPANRPNSPRPRLPRHAPRSDPVLRRDDEA